jgi:peptide/nickel transport system ATP-binding protein
MWRVAYVGRIDASHLLAVAILEIEGLRTGFQTERGFIRAVDGVTLGIDAGETVALVGESGSGKSVLSLSVMGLVPSPGRVTDGSVRFEGQELIGVPEREMRSIRGNRMAMIFQDPMTSLNPVIRIGDQVAEVVRNHQSLDRKAARERAVELLDQVGIPDGRLRSRDYPHQLSGGMRQRVMIAMAIACNPSLLIADEPTTALDVTIQAQILDLFRDLQRRTGMTMLFVTHDLGVVAELADRVAVMYAGRVVESAPVRDLFRRPRMPYTAGLLASIPRIEAAGGRLHTIEGVVPNPLERPAGCAFRPRCPYAVEECGQQTPPMEEVGPEQSVRCMRWKQLDLTQPMEA